MVEERSGARSAEPPTPYQQRPNTRYSSQPSTRRLSTHSLDPPESPDEMAVKFNTGADSRLNVSLLQTLTPSFTEISVIDMSAATSPNLSDRMTLAKQIRKVCETIGFFYISNHGVDEKVVADVFVEAKKFFDEPTKVKSQLTLNEHYRGYHPLYLASTGETRKGDVHESFDWGTPNTSYTASLQGLVPTDDLNLWPPSQPSLKRACEKYFEEVVSLGRRLLHLFALSLDLPEDYFDEFTKGPACVARLIHYPPQDPVGLDYAQIGIGAHTDWELFTILAQDDVPALQVLNANNEWIQATPIPGTFVINVADSLMRWTNDVFQSTVHRAINVSGRERFSIPLFWGADYDRMIKPLETCVWEGRPSRYEEINVQEYIRWRNEQTYSHTTEVLNEGIAAA